MAQEERHFDAQGTPVKSRQEALVTAAATGSTNTACLELRNGNAQFFIEVTFDPNTTPFLITGGTITGNICGAPWEVTGGSMGSSLRIEARRQGSGQCADTITILGDYQVPPSWSGTYGFNSSGIGFTHNTLFRGYSSCE